MNKFADAIDDCDECLKIEPQNIKAMLRKAEALSKCNKVQSVLMNVINKMSIPPHKLTIILGIRNVRRGFKTTAR